MPSTYSKILLHCVFSTKDRAPLITQALQPRLFEYMGGVCRDLNCTLLRAGGVSDHVHILVRISHAISAADLMRDVKAGSSRWIRAERLATGFTWQEGYGVFGVSESQSARVK